MIIIETPLTVKQTSVSLPAEIGPRYYTEAYMVVRDSTTQSVHILHTQEKTMKEVLLQMQAKLDEIGNTNTECKN